MRARTLPELVLAWLVRWQQMSAVVLLVLCIGSALGVINAVHLTRQQYSELQELQASQDHLDNEYERLLLEQSAWAGYARIDRVARDDLKMRAPQSGELVVVER